MANDVTFIDEIEGYCTPLSTRVGEPVALHVSTHAEHFDVQIERWGAQREVVWQSAGLAGVFTQPPPDADANGCGWPISLTIPVDASWRSGFYLVTMTAQGATAGRDIAYACFVVRAAAATSATNRALLVLATNTWNSYNIWGGASLYTGANQVNFERPFGRGMLCRPVVERDDRKARPVRWGEEADADGLIFQDYRTRMGYSAAIGSTGWFTHERRFVEWAEGSGYRFDYAISSDLEHDPDALDGYDLVLLVGHDEYWSAGQRGALERHVEGGGNVAAFSGNTMFWQVRLEGEAATAMVCHKYSALTTDPLAADEPARLSGMWADPVVGNPEWKLFGAGSAFGLYHRFGQATPLGAGGFTVYRHDHWLFEGTNLRYGDLLGTKHGVVGYETVGCRLTFDEYQLPIAAPFEGMPEQVEIVAFTASSNLGVGEYPKSISALSDQGDLEFIAERVFGGADADALAKARYGNSVMLTCRPYGNGGGEVVTVGTTDWVFGLADDPAVAQVTANALRRYGASSAAAESNL